MLGSIVTHLKHILCSEGVTKLQATRDTRDIGGHKGYMGYIYIYIGFECYKTI